MNAHDLIADMTARGISIRAEGPKLKAAGPLTDDDRAAIRANKPELLALLTPPPVEVLTPEFPADPRPQTDAVDHAAAHRLATGERSRESPTPDTHQTNTGHPDAKSPRESAISDEESRNVRGSRWAMGFSHSPGPTDEPTTPYEPTPTPTPELEAFIRLKQIARCPKCNQLDALDLIEERALIFFCGRCREAFSILPFDSPIPCPSAIAVERERVLPRSQWVLSPPIMTLAVQRAFVQLPNTMPAPFVGSTTPPPQPEPRRGAFLPQPIDAHHAKRAAHIKLENAGAQKRQLIERCVDLCELDGGQFGLTRDDDGHYHLIVPDDLESPDAIALLDGIVSNVEAAELLTAVLFIRGMIRLEDVR